MLSALGSSLPWLLVAAVLILPVLLRYLAEEEPGNSTEHESVDEPRDLDPPELLAAA